MTDTPTIETAKTDSKANARVASGAALMALLMIGAAYASVPLYDLFCRVTGYGGTTQVADIAPGAVNGAVNGEAARMITVRFDASLNRQLPWAFEAPDSAVELPIGESGLAFYSAKNLTDRQITGTATYNVSPDKAGYYFSKIEKKKRILGVHGGLTPRCRSSSLYAKRVSWVYQSGNKK